MKIKLLSYLAILALGTVICLPSMVMAWTLPGTFIENGTDPNGVNHGQFDKIEIFMIDGSSFNAPFIQAASLPGGWSSTLVDPEYTLVTGSLTNLLGPFTVELPDPSTNQHVLDYLVWNANTLLYSQRVTWNGTGSGGDYNGWSYPILVSNGSTYTYNGTNGTYDRAPIPSTSTYNGTNGTYDRAPIPPTLLLLGTGLLGLIGLRRKFRSTDTDDFN